MITFISPQMYPDFYPLIVSGGSFGNARLIVFENWKINSIS
jgi:hypothetical protein